MAEQGSNRGGEEDGSGLEKCGFGSGGTLQILIPFPGPMRDLYDVYDAAINH